MYAFTQRFDFLNKMEFVYNIFVCYIKDNDSHKYPE